MANFENSKIGDTCYSLRFGEGKIKHIIISDNYPILVDFDNGYTDSFTIEGFKNKDHLTPEIYHSKPIIAEEKRMVTKTIERWVNVCPNNYEFLYKSQEDAEKSKSNNRIACVKLTGTYEIEE